MTRGSGRFLLATSLLALTSAAPGAETVTYSYDSLGRLTAVSRSGTVNNGITANYSYDSADNRTNVTVTTGGASSPPPASPPPASPPASSPPPPAFSITGGAANEGSNLIFTISKSGSTTSSLSVNYATSNGSASAPGDYYPASGTLTFAGSEINKTVTVATIADGVAEPAETVVMTLSSPTGGATINAQYGQAAGTISSSAANSPPTPVTDNVSIARCTAGSFNVVANDTDADGNYPLTLVGVSVQGLQHGASLASSTSIGWEEAPFAGLYTMSYTVQDSQGASAQGVLNITVTGTGTGPCA